MTDKFSTLAVIEVNNKSASIDSDDFYSARGTLLKGYTNGVISDPASLSLSISKRATALEEKFSRETRYLAMVSQYFLSRLIQNA